MTVIKEWKEMMPQLSHALWIMIIVSINRESIYMIHNDLNGSQSNDMTNDVFWWLVVYMCMNVVYTSDNNSVIEMRLLKRLDRLSFYVFVCISYYDVTILNRWRMTYSPYKSCLLASHCWSLALTAIIVILLQIIHFVQQCIGVSHLFHFVGMKSFGN